MHLQVSELPNEKEVVYGALEKWIAWETEFPLIAASKALVILRKRNQWLRLIQAINANSLDNPTWTSQVAKWMLSKGQGLTMGTYDTLLLAFDMDQRVDEAESLWNMILHTHTRSVSKRLFSRMISLYDHHEMTNKIIEVFADMEELGVKPDEDTFRRVACAFQKLGQEEKQKLVLEKYQSKWKYIHFTGERVKVRRDSWSHGSVSTNGKFLPKLLAKQRIVDLQAQKDKRVNSEILKVQRAHQRRAMDGRGENVNKKGSSGNTSDFDLPPIPNFMDIPPPELSSSTQKFCRLKKSNQGHSRSTKEVSLEKDKFVLAKRKNHELERSDQTRSDVVTKPSMTVPKLNSILLLSMLVKGSSQFLLKRNKNYLELSRKVEAQMEEIVRLKTELSELAADF
ncbi:hypothetical protein GIB67_039923 [Kingdonia uniflora]|uniref:Pentatricopeptide repeat-containing protein n=1 Tax=Kingdonia uniflora TaxID=39325 RepID=A0A7J7P3Y6_9MAGN|nr:hypothetical protein GIB67_039923 [Kingdonia uniflora]